MPIQIGEFARGESEPAPGSAPCGSLAWPGKTADRGPPTSSVARSSVRLRAMGRPNRHHNGKLKYRSIGWNRGPQDQRTKEQWYRRTVGEFRNAFVRCARVSQRRSRRPIGQYADALRAFAFVGGLAMVMSHLRQDPRQDWFRAVSAQYPIPVRNQQNSWAGHQPPLFRSGRDMIAADRITSDRASLPVSAPHP
jgi:hypothetical protein